MYTVWKDSRDTNTSIEFKVTFTPNGINVEKNVASSGKAFGGLGEVEVIGQARVKKSGGNQGMLPVNGNGIEDANPHFGVQLNSLYTTKPNSLTSTRMT